VIQTGPQFRDFIEEQLETTFDEHAIFIGVGINAERYGVVAFDNYTDYDIELFYAGQHFLTRSLIRLVFNYIFNQLGCHRCTSRISADNDKALSIIKRLGFTEEGRLRQAIDGQDVVIHGLLRSECRYINDGQKEPTKSTRSN